MENTLENKAKFFAQYWGQEILNIDDNEGCIRILSHTMSRTQKNFCLELKPISLITGEDAIIVSKIENDKYTEDHLVRGQVLIKTFNEYSNCTHSLKNINQLMEMVDYLRSKGYALSWMGLSVEKLQEYGWVKLKSE